MFTWKDELAVGLKEIDDEHMELFSLFQALSSDIRADRDIAIIKSAVAYLDDYTAGHFEREERYMKDLKYPAGREHKQEHRKFIRDFSKLKTHILKKGNVSLWSLQLEEFVRDWFVSHIQDTDKKLADFLRGKLLHTPRKAK